MTHYAIGDVQGYLDELVLLLARVGFNHGMDTLWLVDDTVNRGLESLEALKFAKEHDSSVQMVLGNHGLYFLAVGCGKGTPRRNDTAESILTHPKSQSLLDWLHHRSLLTRGNRHVMVHADTLPQWSVNKAESLACEVETEL